MRVEDPFGHSIAYVPENDEDKELLKELAMAIHKGDWKRMEDGYLPYYISIDTMKDWLLIHQE